METHTILLIPGLLCDGYVWEPLLGWLGFQGIVADLTTQDSLAQMASDCLALALGGDVARLAPGRGIF